jgi:hypothetical protein
VDKLSTASPAEYIALLGKVWQATSDSDGDEKVVYPILEANQDKLNRTLVACTPIGFTTFSPKPHQKKLEMLQ